MVMLPCIYLWALSAYRAHTNHGDNDTKCMKHGLNVKTGNEIRKILLSRKTPFQELSKESRKGEKETQYRAKTRITSGS